MCGMSKNVVKNLLGISFVLHAIYLLLFVVIIAGQKIIFPVLYGRDLFQDVFYFPAVSFAANAIVLLLHLCFVAILIKQLEGQQNPRCTVPWNNGTNPNKEEQAKLWDRYYTEAPERQRQPAEQYKIVKRV